MAKDDYRRHAAECLALAEQVTDSNQRLTLIDMAQSWLELAVQAEKNGQPDLVYETGL